MLGGIAMLGVFYVLGGDVGVERIAVAVAVAVDGVWVKEG